jgi:extracellular matrix regulatory protein A
LIPIGQDNFVERDRVVAVVPAESSPSKRQRRDAAEKSRLIDATGGRKTRSLIILDTGQVVLCALQPGTLRARLDHKPEVERGKPRTSEIEDGSET